MSFIDRKYISLLSSQLQKFSRKKEDLYNFRCPYCGDSQRNRNRTRGYLYRVKNDFLFKCHNCGVGTTFVNFLKQNAPLLYDEYLLERYREGLTGKGSVAPTPQFNFKVPQFKKNIFSELETIQDLNTTHPARKYLERRKLPPEYLSKLYYCPKFKEWTNKHKPTFKDTKYDESRIIIPMLTKDGVIGFQGRALYQSAIRYITVMLNDDSPKIYGLDKIDDSKKVYITEGPFDSLFLDNSIAMCGADVNVSQYNWQKIYIYDNEPRNRQIADRMSKTIDNGNEIVIWPSQIKEKDINDMVLAGHEVKSVVEYNTYKGLEAKLKFTDWKLV
jgi:hypothetical protein